MGTKLKFILLLNLMSVSQHIFQNMEICGQSFKRFPIVNYDSRVIVTRNLFILGH